MKRVRVVLVEPQHPGNVGATARAMKNMGLTDLVIVDPPCFDAERARWMAPGCADVIANMRIVASLDEALEGIHHAVAATARHRRTDQAVQEPHELAEDIVASEDRWAILFGREDHGLSGDDVHRCERVLRIATPEHASLNLAQAVLLTSYALFQEFRSEGLLSAEGRTLGGRHGGKTTRMLQKRARDDKEQADLALMEPAISELCDLLYDVGYMRGTPRSTVELTARQSLQKARPTVKHITALRGMIRKVRWALDHPDVDVHGPRTPRSER